MTDQEKSILDIVHDKLDNVLNIMNGNGKIGLCAQVEINKSSIDGMKSNCEKIQEEKKQAPDKWGKWIVRIVGIIMAIGQGLLAYKILTGV